MRFRNAALGCALWLLGCASPAQVKPPATSPDASCAGAEAFQIHNGTPSVLEVVVGWGNAGRVVDVVEPSRSSKPLALKGDTFWLRAQGSDRPIDRRREPRIRIEPVCSRM